MTETLNDHQPGYAVLAELHRLQTQKPPLSNVGLAFGINPLVNEAKSWYTGYLGEIEVGKRLNKLRAEGYTVLHGVQPGKSDADVDHLVITPSGFVYAINTKHHRGKRISVYGNKIYITGHEQAHVRNSRSEVKKVLRFLDAAKAPISGTQGVLVFVAPSALEIKKQPDDIALVKESEIVRKIKNEEAARKSSIPFDASAMIDPAFWKQEYDWGLLASQQERLDWFASLQKQMARREAAKFAWLLLGFGIGAAVLYGVLRGTGVIG